MSLVLNQQLFEYYIIRVLGQGVLGTVYLAHDEHLDRPVAIKELTVTSRTDEVAFKRFLREARTAGNLNHPNIVTVHALKIIEFNVYLVMEYLAGGSLRTLLEKRGALPAKEAVRIAADVCEGLAAAHAKGIIHRDIKPEHILLAEDGHAKVADFGIAHLPDSARGTSLSEVSFRPGRLLYMSPEQAQGQLVDERSDVYQVGAVLYEMLTGHHYVDMDALERRARETAGSNVMLFHARLYETMTEAVCEWDPGAVRKSRPEVPEWATVAVAAAMTKERETRPTLGAFAGMLRNQEDGQVDRNVSASMDQANVRLLVGDWSTTLDQLDGEIKRLQALTSYLRYLVASLTQGNAILLSAQRRTWTMGQIPIDILNKLGSLDWTSGPQTHIVHLQLVWRLYNTFEQRRRLKAIQEELSAHDRFPFKQYETVLSNLRGAHRTIYAALESQGVDPYALDQMLDEEIDLIEWLLELRLWNYLSTQYDQITLAQEGMYEWWLAERDVAAQVTADPQQPIGHPTTVQSDLTVLHHGIHDTKVKSMVTMAIVTAHNTVSMDTMTQLLAKLAGDPAFDSPTLEKTWTAFHLALERVDTKKRDFDAAMLSASILVQAQEPLKEKLHSVICNERSDDAKAHYEMGLRYEQQGRSDEAIREFQAALRIDPDLAKVHFHLGTAYEEQGNWFDAIREYQAARRIQPDYAEAYYNLGTVYYLQGQVEEAIHEYQAVLHINPDHIDAHNNLGLAYWQQGHMGEAIREFQAALQIDPKYVEAHGNLGVAYVNLDRLDEAIHEYKAALRIDPNHAQMHNNLGETYRLQGRVEEAVREFQAALRINPDCAEAHFRLGVAHGQQGRLDDEIREYQAALRINSDFVEAHGNLGSAYGQQGRLDEAIHECQTALHINPDYAEAHCNLAAAYRQQGRPKEAMYEAQIALELGFEPARRLIVACLRDAPEEFGV